MNATGQVATINNTRRRLRIGTRSSALALWQAEHIAGLLRAVYPELEIALHTITTQGDAVRDRPLTEFGGTGVFTTALEQALRADDPNQRVDLAVHSLKDLPTAGDPAFIIGAIPERGDPRDVWIAHEATETLLADLPYGSRIGTGSPRRAAQLQAAYPDHGLQIIPIRGNVPTRIAKLDDLLQGLDGIVLAAAGLDRLQLRNRITAYIPFKVMLPAPGQGALAVQCRTDDRGVRALLGAIHHLPSACAVTAERALLTVLEAGCHLPVAAYADWITIQPGQLPDQSSSQLQLTARVLAPDGSQAMTDTLSTMVITEHDAYQLGATLARRMLINGARNLLG